MTVSRNWGELDTPVHAHMNQAVKVPAAVEVRTNDAGKLTGSNGITAGHFGDNAIPTSPTTPRRLSERRNLHRNDNLLTSFRSSDTDAMIASASR